MITINNSVFDAKGADKKAKVYGITLNGSEDITISGCEFKNMGYSSILNDSTGNVVVEDCSFDCSNVYNPIEGSQKVDNGNVSIRRCEFAGTPGNNYINFYQFKNGSEHLIENCSFAPGIETNAIRVSNKTSAGTRIVVKDCEYTYAEGEPTEYTNFILCQDYTSNSGVKQDFTNVKFEIENVKCNGVVLEDGVAPAKGGIFYVYQDGAGIITGQDNDPKITIK